jgi:hypothetical protein
MLHLHGPWGSGKTTLLKLLRKELTADGAEPPGAAASRSSVEAGHMSRHWIVVEFNAWRHQRLDPPWWFFMDSVFREAHRQIRDDLGERGRAARLHFSELLWRFVTGRRDAIQAGAVIILLLGIIYFLLRLTGNLLSVSFSWLSDDAIGISDVLALAGTVFSAALVFARSSVPGSARAAQNFVRSAADPMKRICQYFRDMIGQIGQPIIILVDDLDRCREDHVVSLLEGIQTLFSDPRVIYVVAADRKWLFTCFESAYEAFSDTVAEPGRRLGSLFLEKAFQLSVSVPRLSQEVQEGYWDYLIRGGRGTITEQLAEARRNAQRVFSAAETEDEVFVRLEESNGQPMEVQAFCQAAVERLAHQRVELSTEAFLRLFVHLLERTPRAMKRLLNAYAINRDLAILGGLKVLTDLDKRKQLALWTILTLRWPLLEEHFIKVASGKKVTYDERILASLRAQEVRQVVKGEGVGVPLDVEAVRDFVGLRVQASEQTVTL